MKIVIEIPEELLGKINDENYQSLISWYDTSLYCAIKDGTPLPKGHGDLIDRNTVQMSAEKFHSLGDLHTAQWVVDNTPTVIPADKGEKKNDK